MATTFKQTKDGIIIKLRAGDIHAPKHWSVEDVRNFMAQFPLGMLDRTEKIRTAVNEAKVR